MRGGIDVLNDLPCPQRSWGRGNGHPGVQRCGSGKNQISPSWAYGRSYPSTHPIPNHTHSPPRLSISLCIFRLVSHLNTYAYLICHGFASGPCSKGKGSRGGKEIRIRRMAYYIIDWIFVREFNKICKFSFFGTPHSIGRRDEPQSTIEWLFSWTGFRGSQMWRDVPVSGFWD